jgi:hypothetical protein
MNVIWHILHQNFKDCIEDGSTGVNSLTSISSSFTESEDTVELKSIPSSIYDHKYSILLDNINDVNVDIATNVADFDYNIRLQFAFELNMHADRDGYNKAIQDIEEVIRKRLKYSTWQNTDIINITFVTGNKFQFLSSDLERFTIAEIVFRCVGRTTLL